MRQTSQNTFVEGLNKDLNPITTPNNILTDCLNGTIITYNGNEFILQNDMGNCKVERARLSVGFIPLGMKEYGSIIYVASYNPETKQCEVGSFPSPERDFSTSDFTNIQPVNFRTINYVLDTGDDSIVMKTTKVGKLFEPELFQLHPGDMYVVLYTIHDVDTTSSLSTEIDTNTKYTNYISSDPNNRKLFKLKFSKITDSNQLVDIDSSSIKVIPNKENIENEYVYFTQNSNSTLAVSLELEGLDVFDANVVNASLMTNPDKKIGIEALGISNSLSIFQGVRVQVKSPIVETFFLDKTADNKKVSAILSGLAANDEFECSIVPYSPYTLYPKLQKDFKVSLGDYNIGSTGVNSLFRYYTAPTYIKVEFDYKFQGSSSDGVHLYVEFYDPWSDYSIIKTVDNPTYYGINTVIVELVDEPRVDTFTATTTGGTSPSKLQNNSDTVYEKSILNSTNLIRTDQKLRRNHFYIVRISGADRVKDNNGSFTYDHYDLFKGMYTNTMFNDIYNAQGGLSITSVGYVGDFNTLDFLLDKIGYTSSIISTGNTISNPIVTTQRDDLTTNGSYYSISKTVQDKTVPYKYNKQYESKSTYNIDMALTGSENIFGDFKEDLLTIVSPILVSSNANTGNRPSVVDVNYDNDPNISPTSLATWLLTNITSKSFKLVTDLITNRSIYAPVLNIQKGIKIYAAIPLLPSLYYKPNADGIFSPNKQATIFIGKYDLHVERLDGTSYDYHLNSGQSPDDNLVLDAINAALPSRTYSALVMTSNDSTWGYGSATDYNSCNDGGQSVWKHCNMLLKSDDGNYFRLTKTIDIDAIVQFFSSLFVASNVPGTVNVYYPNNALTVSNGQIQTISTYPDIIFTTNFTPDSVNNVYIKTYLSRFRMHATGYYGDFSAQILNDYIETRITNSNIIDNKKTLRDGFIPYIDQVKTSTDNVIVPPITINQAADNSVLSKYAAGQAQYLNDPALSEGPRTHGTLYTTNEPLYSSYVSKLDVKNVDAGVTIDPNKVYVSAKPTIYWTGFFAYAGRCKDDNRCPTLMPSFDIKKQ